MAERRYKATRSEPEAAEWRALLEPGSRHVTLDACWSGDGIGGPRHSRLNSDPEETGDITEEVFAMAPVCGGGQSAPARGLDAKLQPLRMMYRVDKAVENVTDSREETCTSGPCGPGRFDFNFMNHLDSEPAAYDGSG
ncbi:hypothetical protein FOZ61_003280 [Perkinsus olseni]|uniref:Uncharacterized protein n=1 Tax=Perkinsus olseni TaxID=32597 RepID=A0A7J6MIH6_PEROL|nr:hypothetical protein FOL46_005263 [Perkinsus olseni]KAF4671343.1 hypothetical protein FOZ61_003280 [Perkinsus olseni]